jgi:HEAT repeat protein
MNLSSMMEIVRLIETPIDDIRPLKRQLVAEAPTSALIAALNAVTNPPTRWLICDVLGQQGDTRATPALLACLTEESATMRAIAAEGLGRIGSPEAGPALLERFSDPREDAGVRRMAGGALGAVGYRPALNVLVAALSDPDAGVRAGAALALGLLKMPEAIAALKVALENETEWYPQRRMVDALVSIGEP